MEKDIPKNNLDNRKIKKELDGLSSRSKKSKLKLTDLVIPISAFVILILLSLFLFMPMINTANGYRAELREISSKMDSLESLEKELQALDDTQLLDDLVVAKVVIPKVLKVSDFVFYIDNLAQTKNLTTKEISASDVGVGGSTTQVKGSLGVRAPLAYSGSYEDILDFLEEIQGFSPYLVTLKNISMTRGDDAWSVEFDLTGYYIPEKDYDLDLYMAFSPYTKFSDIIDIFQVRSSQLDEL